MQWQPLLILLHVFFEHFLFFAWVFFLRIFYIMSHQMKDASLPPVKECFRTVSRDLSIAVMQRRLAVYCMSCSSAKQRCPGWWGGHEKGPHSQSLGWSQHGRKKKLFLKCVWLWNNPARNVQSSLSIQKSKNKWEIRTHLCFLTFFITVPAKS